MSADINWDGESHGGELYKWEKPGQKVTGVLLNKRIVNTKLGAMTAYDLLTKEGEVVVPGTKGLNDSMKRYPANGSLIVQIEFVEEKKGNFPNPFKVFTVKYAKADEARLKALGITMFEEDPNEAAVKSFDAMPDNK